MLRMLGSERRNCDGVSRRETLQAGGLATLGSLFGMPSSMLNASVNSDSGGKAKSVIVLYLLGGAPTQDMWDMKPDAPGGVGGEFKPVASNVSGMDVCLQGRMICMHLSNFVFCKHAMSVCMRVDMYV